MPDIGFTDFVKDRNKNVTNLQNQTLINYQVMLQTVRSENKRLINANDKIINEHSADGQKSKYMKQSGDIIWTIYKYSFWVYMVCITILAVLIYLQPYSIYFKIVLILLMYGFPFYIYPTELYLYKLFEFLWSILLSQIYSNGF